MEIQKTFFWTEITRSNEWAKLLKNEWLAYLYVQLEIENFIFYWPSCIWWDDIAYDRIELRGLDRRDIEQM